MNRNSQHRFVRGLSMVGLNVIVLAAGRSSRLGQPKAFVEVGGRPLIEHLVHRLQHLHGVEITVVSNDDLLADVLLACPSVHAVLNPNPEHGRTGSIQTGLASISERGGGLPKHLLVVPVDRPGWSIEIVNKLIESKKTSCPESEGRGGHPLYLVGEDITAVYLSKSDEPLSSIVQRHQIPVDFKWLHLNIDTVADLDELKFASTEDWF